MKNKTCCPHCESLNFVKNGTFNTIQRYKCRNQICQKGFSDATNTFFYYCKKAQYEMTNFSTLSHNSLPLRAISFTLNISLKTAFSWRHKLLDVYETSNNNHILKGIIDINTAFLYENFKGQKNISKQTRDRIQVLLPLDSDARSNPKLIHPFSTKLHTFSEAFSPLISKDSFIFSSGSNFLTSFKQKHNFNKKIPTNPSVFNKHSLVGKFLLWLDRFRGVATKYITQYASWFFVDYKLIGILKTLDF